MNRKILELAIENLIKKRKKAHDNPEEQARINAELSKLYNLKYGY